MEFFTGKSFYENGGKFLSDENFFIDVVEDVDQFVNLLKTNKYDSAIIINDFMQDYVQMSSKSKQLEYVETVKTFWRKGGGLYIFEENDTIYYSLSN